MPRGPKAPAQKVAVAMFVVVAAFLMRLGFDADRWVGEHIGKVGSRKRPTKVES